MKNADLVRAAAEVAKIRTDLAAARRRRESAATQVERLERALRDVERVTRVVDGVALEEHGGWIEALGQEIQRCAQIYPNAHNQGATWGLYTYESSFGRKGERWHGAHLAHDEAERLAYEWVLRGVRPTRRGQPA